MKKSPLKSVSKLKKKADSIFSLWIRNRDKQCVTCGSRSNLQAGHYISRSWSSLRFSEVNVNTQCVGCNVFKSGNMPEYAAFLERKYGHGIIQDLLKQKVVHQFKVPELEEIIEKYRKAPVSQG